MEVSKNSGTAPLTNPTPGSDEAREAIAAQIVPLIFDGANKSRLFDGIARSDMMAEDVFTTYDKNRDNILAPEEVDDKDLYNQYFNYDVDDKGNKTNPKPTNFVDATVNYFNKYYKKGVMPEQKSE